MITNAGPGNRPLRVALALLAATASAQCFSPSYQEGVPCGADDACPGNQVCAADGRCYSPGNGPTVDAANPGDSSADGSPDAMTGCTPNVNFCVGDEVYSCFANGTQGSLLQECALGLCVDGSCIDTCAAARSVGSYFGCEYWPVDLDNALEVMGRPIAGSCSHLSEDAQIRTDLRVCHDGSGGDAGLCDPGDLCPQGYACEPAEVCVLDAQSSPFAVVVANPNPESPVTVTIRDATGASSQVQVPAGSIVAVEPVQQGLADQSVDGSGQTASAYQLTSSAPIVAYQYNPLDNTNVFANDASLLLPAHVLGTDYYAITQPTLVRRPATNDYNGYVTVVATSPGTTELRVTPAAATRPGDTVTGIAAGQPRTFTLSQFDVLSLESEAGDLSGTRIESVNGEAFAAFSGHEAATISLEGEQRCCADHLEEQLFPETVLATEYAVPRSQPRMTGDRDILRILAQSSDTTLSFTPAPALDECSPAGPLAAGQWCDVEIETDTVITATSPILVAQFLTSVADTGGMNPDVPGDPSLGLLVPPARARTTYSFLVPAAYDENYVAVAAPTGTTVRLDGVDMSASFSPIAGSSFLAGRLPVSTGPHAIDCRPNRCIVQVHGYSEAVSYLFAAGLDFLD